ncbi:RING-H2 finger protein ATL22-like [Chenopodium quinoa]|nr:RING-H2 finger protein ATL22-like [Chenopodium quinoa]
MPRTCNAEPCEATVCNGNVSLVPIPIKFPFRIVGQQAKSCGSPGFDLYCDHKLGNLLRLPNAGNFTVDAISYSLREIKLSDPSNCLPQKLLSLNLTTTPFRGVRQKDFWVYNCSGVGDHSDLYDEIDCLGGSNYKIVSVPRGVNVTNTNCKLMKIVSVPTNYGLYKLNITKLSNHSSIDLTWDKQTCESCESFTWTSPAASDSNKNSLEYRTLVAIVTTFVVLFLIFISCTLCILLSRKNVEQPAIITTTNTVYTDSDRYSITLADVAGLDLTTINSYPMVVIGESRRQIKPGDDKNCPICLTDYSRGDTLKTLPDCLHRFHAGCIDPWLRAKASCPICRTSPRQNS